MNILLAFAIGVLIGFAIGFIDAGYEADKKAEAVPEDPDKEGE